nr:MAG TPA: hypothetical protein [Caudoviricetes sp.]
MSTPLLSTHRCWVCEDCSTAEGELSSPPLTTLRRK